MPELQRLGDLKAPKGFADRLLAHVGVADSYARFDSVLGPVYVAWNPRGVSAAARMDSPAEVEQWVRKDVWRHVVAGPPPAGAPPQIAEQQSGKKRRAVHPRRHPEGPQARARE